MRFPLVYINGEVVFHGSLDYYSLVGCHRQAPQCAPERRRDEGVLGKRGEAAMSDLLLMVGVMVVWVVLMSVILPRLGVGT